MREKPPLRFILMKTDISVSGNFLLPDMPQSPDFKLRFQSLLFSLFFFFSFSLSLFFSFAFFFFFFDSLPLHPLSCPMDAFFDTTTWVGVGSVLSLFNVLTWLLLNVPYVWMERVGWREYVMRLDLCCYLNFFYVGFPCVSRERMMKHDRGIWV